MRPGAFKTVSLLQHLSSWCPSYSLSLSTSLSLPLSPSFSLSLSHSYPLFTSLYHSPIISLSLFIFLSFFLFLSTSLVLYLSLASHRPISFGLHATEEPLMHNEPGIQGSRWLQQLSTLWWSPVNNSFQLFSYHVRLRSLHLRSAKYR